MNGFTETVSMVFQFGWDATTKSGVVLVLATVCAWFARRSSAASRHRVWALAMSICLLIPLVSLLLPPIPIPILPAINSAILSPTGDPAVLKSPIDLPRSRDDVDLQTARSLGNPLDRSRLSQSDSTIEAVVGMPVIPCESDPVQSGPVVELQERGVGSSLLMWFCEALLLAWLIGIAIWWSLLVIAMVNICRSTPGRSRAY
jgi:hypothetical protein